MEDGIHRTRRVNARVFGTFVAAGVAATALLGYAGEARAAGFALKEQSATALGNAFAGATAGAEDVSYMFFNPAGLTRHEGSQAAAVLSYIMPVAETNDAADGSGAFAAGSASQDGGVNELVPAAYGMWSINPDLKLAVGVNVPFGLSTEYDLGWQGAAYAIESSVTTVNVNPAIAYRVNGALSLGVGLQAQFVDVTLSSQLPGGGNPLFAIKGDDWGFGFNAGALFELSPQTRLGAAYRSQIESKISGTASLQGAGSTGASADLTTPDMASVGIYHELSNNFAVMGEISWTGWSTFDEIRANLDSNLGPVTSPVVVPENWKDVWFYSAGATWKPNQDWTIRTGVAFDDSPVPNTTRSPRLPGNDRLWLALGAEFAPTPNLSLSAGYTHIWVHDATVNLNNPTPFTASFEGHIDIIAAQATFRF